MAFEKDPNSTKDFAIDWTAWLNGDTIATSTFQVSGDLTKVTESNTTLIATVMLSGGTPGEIYRIRNRITTAAGRVEDQTFDLTVRDK